MSRHFCLGELRRTFPSQSGGGLARCSSVPSLSLSAPFLPLSFSLLPLQITFRSSLKLIHHFTSSHRSSEDVKYVICPAPPSQANTCPRAHPQHPQDPRRRLPRRTSLLQPRHPPLRHHSHPPQALPTRSSAMRGRRWARTSTRGVRRRRDAERSRVRSGLCQSQQPSSRGGVGAPCRRERVSSRGSCGGGGRELMPPLCAL